MSTHSIKNSQSVTSVRYSLWTIACDLNVRWPVGKLHIYRKLGRLNQERYFWWLRCDVCLNSGRLALGVALTFDKIIETARCHASVCHNVRL